jgi:GT2 family glycosyltransferase
MPRRLSVVIPTRNRGQLLTRTLGALARQTAPAEDFEVIVVADGCTDETAAVVRAFPAPFTLKLVEQPATGPAAGRNRGAAKADSPLVLFFDDDMEAAPQLVAAHLAAHDAHPGGVVLGYFPLPDPGGRADVFRAAIKAWWDQGFAARAEPAHRNDFRDFCTGNVSLSKRLFEESGGFDLQYPGASTEDYDLGVRLLRRGVRFHFAREAASLHHDRPTCRRTLDRAGRDGYALSCWSGSSPSCSPCSNFPGSRGSPRARSRARSGACSGGSRGSPRAPPPCYASRSPSPRPAG